MIHLHEVLDSRFVKTVQPLMKGKTFMVRHADDRRQAAEPVFARRLD
jgi:hypothetical protein